MIFFICIYAVSCMDTTTMVHRLATLGGPAATQRSSDGWLPAGPPTWSRHMEIEPDVRPLLTDISDCFSSLTKANLMDYGRCIATSAWRSFWATHTERIDDGPDIPDDVALLHLHRGPAHQPTAMTATRHSADKASIPASWSCASSEALYDCLSLRALSASERARQAARQPRHPVPSPPPPLVLDLERVDDECDVESVHVDNEVTTRITARSRGASSTTTTSSSIFPSDAATDAADTADATAATYPTSHPPTRHSLSQSLAHLQAATDELNRNGVTLSNGASSLTPYSLAVIEEELSECAREAERDWHGEWERLDEQHESAPLVHLAQTCHKCQQTLGHVLTRRDDDTETGSSWRADTARLRVSNRQSRGIGWLSSSLSLCPRCHTDRVQRAMARARLREREARATAHEGEPWVCTPPVIADTGAAAALAELLLLQNATDAHAAAPIGELVAVTEATRAAERARNDVWGWGTLEAAAAPHPWTVAPPARPAHTLSLSLTLSVVLVQRARCALALGEPAAALASLSVGLSLVAPWSSALPSSSPDVHRTLHTLLSLAASAAKDQGDCRAATVASSLLVGHARALPPQLIPTATYTAYSTQGVTLQACGSLAHAVASLTTATSSTAATPPNPTALLSSLFFLGNAQAALGNYSGAAATYATMTTVGFPSSLSSSAAAAAATLTASASHSRALALALPRILDQPFSTFSLDRWLHSRFKQGAAERRAMWPADEDVSVAGTLPPAPALATPAPPQVDDARALVQAAREVGSRLQLRARGFCHSPRASLVVGLGTVAVAQRLSAWLVNPPSGDVHNCSNYLRGGSGLFAAPSLRQGTWRCLAEEAVRLRQLSEPGDAVFWADRLHQWGLGSVTPVISGTSRPARYTAYAPRLLALTRTMLLDGSADVAVDDRASQRLARLTDADLSTPTPLLRALGRDELDVTTRLTGPATTDTLPGTLLSLRAATRDGDGVAEVKAAIYEDRFVSYDRELDYHLSVLLGTSDAAGVPTLPARRRALLSLSFYWYHLMPLTRGSAAVGLALLAGGHMALGYELPQDLPPDLQPDWEAMLSTNVDEFAHALEPWLARMKAPPVDGAVASPLHTTIPSVYGTLRTPRDFLRATT